VDGCAERSLNLPLVSAAGREKDAAEPVQFGTERTLRKSFSQRFPLAYCLKSF
jgi:hypothetical protein